MANLINEGGWLYLGDSSNYVLILFEECKWDQIEKGAKIKHIAGETQYGFTTQVRWLVWKFKNVYILTHANYSTFMTYMKTWQNAGSITLKVIRHSTPSYIAFDGSNTSYTVMIPEGGIRGWQKLSLGDEDGPYRLDMLTLEESG